MSYDSDVNLAFEPDWGSVPEGTPVISSEGRTLGAVVEKREDGLFVRGAETGEDYMVTASDISRIDAQGVHLIVNFAEAMRVRPETEASGMAPGAMDDDSVSAEDDLTQPGGLAPGKESNSPMQPS